MKATGALANIATPKLGQLGAPKAPGAGAGGEPEGTGESGEPTPSSTPKAGGKSAVALAILDAGHKLQLKRASGGAVPGDKRQKAAKGLVDFLSAVSSGTSIEPDSGGELSFGGDELSLDFIGAPASGSAEPLSLVSRREPGKLFALGLQRVRDRLAALQGGSALDAQDVASALQNRRMMSFYHTVVCRPAHPTMRPHTSREMQTLAELIDSLLEGDIDRCGDIALQRYKALEMSLTDNSWEIAQELEVVDREAPHLATEEERHRASRRKLAEVRLNNALASLRTRAGGDPNVARG